MSAWVQANEELLWWLGTLSFLVFAATLLLAPWFIRRIPADYFTRPRRERRLIHSDIPGLRMALRIARNALGTLFVLAGILMLALPGQGLLTIFIGVLIMDFPGKDRLLHAAVERPFVHRALNRIRRNAGRNPLELRRPRDGKG